MSFRVSDTRWNRKTWVLQAFWGSGQKSARETPVPQFVLTSAFDRDEITLSVAEAQRLRDLLDKFLKEVK